MGIRLYSHTKSMKSTGTLQLNISNEAIKNHEIIYGAMPCVNYKNQEDKLHARYVDLMKTRKNQDIDDEIKMEEVNVDEGFEN